MMARRRRVRIELAPRAMFDHLDDYVIGQTRAKRVVAIAAYNHLKLSATT